MKKEKSGQKIRNTPQKQRGRERAGLADKGLQKAQKELEKALKKIERLEAQNAALRGEGKVNREAKNSVFLDLFKRKEYLVRLYQDLHPDEGDITADDLTVVTLENVLTLKRFNDLGFIRGKENQKLLIMIESQSSWSVNILFRTWSYLVDTLMNYIINNGYNLYSTPKLELPDTETYIIYTGRSTPKIFTSGKLEQDEEGRYILSLSKEFFRGKKGSPELLAKVIYLKNGSGIIQEYIRFSQIFDEQMEKLKTDQDRAKAIQEVFRICRKEKILMEYLQHHQGEVEKIMMTMVSPEYIERAEKKTDKIRTTIEVMRSLKHSDEEIKNYLIEKFHITPGYAQNCLDADWEDED